MTTEEDAGLCDVLTEPALLVDADGAILGCNVAAATLLGEPRDRLAGRRLPELIENGAEVWTRVRETDAGGIAKVDSVLPGARRRCRLGAAAVGPGRLLVTLDADPDVPDLRQVLERLRLTLERLGAPDVLAEQGLVLVGPDGRIEYASRFIEELTGENPVGRPFAAAAERMGMAGDADTSRVHRGHVETFGADGAKRTLEHFRVVLEPVAGRSSGVLHGFRDITAAIRHDHRLENARAVLNRSQHLRALGELAGEVAHEFGNVLQAIGLQTAVLRRQGELPERVARSLASIKQAVDAGHAFTRRLLTFARDDGGRMEPLDVGAVLRDVAQIFEPRIAHEKRPMQLVLSIPLLPQIHGNRRQLSEAFLNVFLNATEAMPEGGTIEVTAAAGGGEVRIAIRDTGVGMTEEAERRAFDPFFTTKPEQAGLGLSTVYGVVRSHGGSVFIESEAGRGTALCMAFPTAEPPAMPAHPAPPTPAASGARVLVVDDHPAVREATAELLAGQGYAVMRAASVAEALGALDRERFRVVVTDVGLPDRPGWDITRAAKERAPETLVVLVTGWGANVSPAHAKARGADLVFEKPLDPDDALLAAIAREIGGVPGGRAAAR